MTDSKESTAEVAYRLANETECRRLAEMLKAQISPGLVFLLITATYGEGGAFSNMNYVSTAQRDDSSRLLTELLDYWKQMQSAAIVEPTVKTATMMREAIFGPLRDVGWRKLLHSAKGSIRNAEAALESRGTRSAKIEVLKACTELMAILDQLQRHVIVKPTAGGN